MLTGCADTGGWAGGRFGGCPPEIPVLYMSIVRLSLSVIAFYCSKECERVKFTLV